MKAVKALLELGDDVDIDDKGVVKGLDEAIKKLQGAEDSKFLFEESKQKQVKGAKPGESGNENGDHGVDTSKMTYSELTAYLAENPDALSDSQMQILKRSEQAYNKSFAMAKDKILDDSTLKLGQVYGITIQEQEQEIIQIKPE